jgi:hypothetical protein
MFYYFFLIIFFLGCVKGENYSWAFFTFVLFVISVKAKSKSSCGSSDYYERKYKNLKEKYNEEKMDPHDSSRYGRYEDES